MIKYDYSMLREVMDTITGRKSGPVRGVAKTWMFIEGFKEAEIRSYYRAYFFEALKQLGLRWR